MTITGRTAQSVDSSRRMFEHVDRRGRVRQLPLTQETQKLVAMSTQGSSFQSETDRQNGSRHGNVKSGTRSFTAREWQVFDLLFSGLSSKQIAYNLDISSRTVEIHRANLMRKMGVRNAVSLI